MSLRDKVSKQGGLFNIYKGDSSWVESHGIRVNLVLTPRVGPRNMGMTSGLHQPGQGFEPHIHPLSEEVVLVVKGKGEIFLKDKWIPVEEGDLVYAPPGIAHGTRNPKENTEEFVTVGCGTPPQLDLYQRAKYDPLADDKTYD